MKKLFILSMFLLMLTAVLASAQTESPKKRGFMFGVGLGWSAALKLSVNGVDYSSLIKAFGPLGLWTELDAGYAVNPKVYVGLDAMVGQPFISQNQNAIYMIGPGVRFYPKTTGFFVGARGGIATARSGTQSTGITWAARPGYDLGVLAGYDFAHKPTGFGWVVGTRVDNSNISGQSIWDLAIYGSALWK